MEVSADQFLNTLESSGLLAADEVEALRAERDTARLDGPKLAARLVKQDRLTAYQARELLAGRASGFFLEKYKILEPIGQGGHGTVFKGEHTSLRRTAAIKVLRLKGAAGPDTLARFQLEARAAAQLEHENIVRVYDIGQVDDTHYIAMEYVPGQSVSQLIRERGRLVVSEAAAIISQVALGLQHAFERGVIHRDVKPSNIVVTPQGAAKVLDMGLARFFGEAADTALAQATITQAGRVMGTVDYIAPEQAEDSHTADTRSDIYALGCTLYQCLAGHVPFPEGTVMQKLIKHREQEPTPIEQLVPEVPASLAATLRRMMAKRPADRFQTPSEVADALRSYLPQAPITVSDLSPIVIEPGSGLFEGAVSAESPTVAYPAPRADLNVVERRPDGTSPLRLTEGDEGYDEEPSPASPGPASEPLGAEAAVATAVEERPEVTIRPQPDIERPLQDMDLDAELPTTVTLSISRRWTRLRKTVAGLAAVVLLLTLAGVGWHLTGQATIVIDWAVAERERGTVEIDGRRYSVSDTGVLEYSSASGRRRVRLLRPGYEPYEQTVTLDRGGSTTITPTWQRTVKAIRQEALVRLEADIQQSLVADPTEARIGPLRDKLVDVLRQNWDGPERRRVAVLMPRLAWPIDSVRQEQVQAYELEIAGRVKSQNAPAALVATLGDSRLKHWSRVWTVAFSPHAPVLASGSEDGTVKLWNSSTGEELRTLQGHNDSVRAVAFSPSGDTLASAGDDGRVVLWDVTTGDRRLTFEGHKAGVLAVAFSPDRELLASASADHTIKLWGITKEAELRTLDGHSAEVHSVVFSPDGQTLISAGNDNTVKRWAVSSGTEQDTWEKNGSPISCLALGPDGRTVALGTKDGGIELWDSTTKEVLGRLGGHKGGVLSLAFSHDGQSLVSGGADRLIRTWDVSERRELQKLQGHIDDQICCVAFSPDDQAVASGGRDRFVKLWNAADGRERLNIEGHTAWIMAFAFSPDGQLIALGNRDGSVVLRDVATGTSRTTAEKHLDAVNCVGFSPDSLTLATGSEDGSVRLWDVGTGLSRQVLRGHTASVYALAFSPDGKTLATASVDKTVRLWDVATGQAGHKLEGHTNWVWCVAFSPDGQTLASGSGDGKVKLWDPAKGKEQQTLGTHVGGVFSLAFSPDGQAIVTAGGTDHYRAKIWPLVPGREQQTLDGHSGRLCSVGVSPDGESLATSAYDGTVRLWSRTGRHLQTFPLGPARGQVLAVSFSPEGRHLAATNGNGNVYILRLAPYQPPQRQ